MQGRNNFWEKNVDAWEKKYPKTKKFLCEKYVEYCETKGKEQSDENTKVNIAASSEGKVALKVQKNGCEKWLAGPREAEKTARLWAESYGKLDAATLMIIIGLGNPFYLLNLDEIFNKSIRVIIYEPSPEVFFEVMENYDLTKLFRSNRNVVFLIKGINEEVTTTTINKIININNLPNLLLYTLPNYENIFTKEIKEFTEILYRRCKAERMGFFTLLHFSNTYAINLFQNMKHVNRGMYARQFTEFIPRDLPTFVVSAGPSLNKNIHELRRAKGKSFIIAVDTAIKPLINAGIVPDMFAVVDGEKPVDLVTIEGAENIPMLTSATSANALLEYNKARKIFFNEGESLVNKLFFSFHGDFDNVPSGGSVATSAFAFAYMIGMRKIILVGQDLSFPGNRTHATGTFKESEIEVDTTNYPKIKGNIEEEVPSRPDMIAYRDWFEWYIKGCKEEEPEMCVWNATEGGAFIEGTEICTLKDIIDELCCEEVDVQDAIARIPSAFNAEQQEKNRIFLQSIPQQFSEINALAKELNDAYEKLQKLSEHKNMDLNAYKKLLTKIEKKTKKIDTYRECSIIIANTLKAADFILRSEQNIDFKSFNEEGLEIARKGILYTKLLMECTTVLGEYAQKTLIDEWY